MLGIFVVPAQATTTPSQAVLTQYCELDFQGARLSSKRADSAMALVHWTEEAGWDQAAVARQHDIAELSAADGKARLEVRYQTIGTFSGNQFFPKETAEDVIFSLQLQQDTWAIAEPMIPPHVSPEALLQRLRRRRASADPAHTDQIKQLNASIEALEAATR